MVTWNNQVFEEGSTFRGTLKIAARAIVATKYDLENVDFDYDRFSNQQGWWEYLESTARELIDKSTFLHQGEDGDVGYQNSLTTGTKNHIFRVYRTISTILRSKSSVFHSTMVALMQLATYFRTSWVTRFPTMLSRWQQQQ